MTDKLIQAAFYNEIDPYCCDWLQNLMDAGHITPGRIDDRSIEDVRPNELAGFERCHFFAGIGVWDYALNQAGWAGPIWTGSCPCQPFSAAGKGKGFDDERHLWPSWYWLIEQCRPSVVVGEQVASKRTEPWIDLVQADLEAMDYAFGCIPFPSAGVGAPHIRDRAYWVGHSEYARLERHAGDGGTAGWQGTSGPVTEAGVSGGMADDPISGRRQECQDAGRQLAGDRTKGQRSGPGSSGGDSRPSPTNGHWRDADWLYCRDGKWRPVEPGTFPLVDGAPARVGRLRAYGNAINASAARVFIESVMEAS